MSSSSDSHRNAYPFSRTVTSFSCFSVAFLRILNRSAGKPMIRPSVSSIKIILFSAQTRRAAGSTVRSFSAVVVISIFLLQQQLMFINKLLDLPQGMRRNPFISRKPDRIKPELAFPFRRFHMYMRRLFEFIGIKMKPVRPYFQDSRHRLYSSASCNLLVPKLFSRHTDRLYCLFLGHAGKRLLTFGRKLT